jgi:hypothetical protein
LLAWCGWCDVVVAWLRRCGVIATFVGHVEHNHDKISAIVIASVSPRWVRHDAG